MDNRFYDNVINEMKPFLEENNFTFAEDGSFINDKKAGRVKYNEERQMYILEMAEVTDGKPGEFAEVSAWLFDDSQNAKDAESVGIDFTNTVRSKLGIKIKRAPVTDVDLPTADKTGNLTASGFAKKVLDVFPQYKDDYKEHIAQYGNFLYINFYSRTLVPQTIEILKANNKKSVKKLFELLDNGYVQGDRETVNAIVAVVSAAIYKEPAIKDAAYEMLGKDTHFKNSVVAFVPVIARKKKIREAIVK